MTRGVACLADRACPLVEELRPAKIGELLLSALLWTQNAGRPPHAARASREEVLALVFFDSLQHQENVTTSAGSRRGCAGGFVSGATAS